MFVRKIRTKNVDEIDTLTQKEVTF
jgi:hypothetical protein